jgi:hypothetical protein
MDYDLPLDSHAGETKKSHFIFISDGRFDLDIPSRT